MQQVKVCTYDVHHSTRARASLRRQTLSIIQQQNSEKIYMNGGKCKEIYLYRKEQIKHIHDNKVYMVYI